MSDDPHILLAAQEQLLTAVGRLARAQTRADVVAIVERVVGEALGFGTVVAMTRGDHGEGTFEGHVLPLGDLTGVLLVDEPDDRALSVRTRLLALRPFADAAGAMLTAVDRLETSREQARNDALTQLPNRAALIERLGVAVARAQRESTRLAVLFLDLDGFKAINDEHGHGTGDLVLRAVAERLAEYVRPQDVVARFGGDEFVVLCEDLASEGAGHAIAARLRSALEAPLEVRGMCLEVGASIGLAFGDGGASAGELLRAADGAMYAAKSRGR